MATLSNRNGCRYIQIVNRDGVRKGVPLGRIEKQQGEEIRLHVDALERAMKNGATLPRKTINWLADLGDTLYAKLAKVGLVESREKRATTKLKAFCDAYIAGRTDISQRSRTNLEQARNALVAHFSADADIAMLTKGQMKDWRRRMLESLSEATVSGHVKKARQMFREAMDHGLMPVNPLIGVAAGSQANESRRVYIPSGEIKKVIDACPDAEWRLIFALARFGGLRTPSETFALRWKDVDFAGQRILVTSPKTKRHAGKGTRLIPLFAELLPYLADAREMAPQDAEFVIRTREAHNIRTHARRIIERAGLSVWTKPFQNMRVSCEADLLIRFPLPWVIAWIGHSARVQREHYNKVPDVAFNAASNGAAPGAAERTGLERNSQDNKGSNPAGNAAIEESDESCRGYWPLSQTAENLKSTEKALHWALRRLRLILPDLRRSDIARLTDSLAVARLEVGGA